MRTFGAPVTSFLKPELYGRAPLGAGHKSAPTCPWLADYPPSSEITPVIFFRPHGAPKVRLPPKCAPLAHLDAEALSKLQTHAPILHVLYYHSKDGAKHLAHYAAHAPSAGWEYTVH